MCGIDDDGAALGKVIPPAVDLIRRAADRADDHLLVTAEGFWSAHVEEDRRGRRPPNTNHHQPTSPVVADTYSFFRHDCDETLCTAAWGLLKLFQELTICMVQYSIILYRVN